jgi:hypothetical protein
MACAVPIAAADGNVCGGVLFLRRGPMTCGWPSRCKRFDERHTDSD